MRLGRAWMVGWGRMWVDVPASPSCVARTLSPLAEVEPPFPSVSLLA